LLAASWSALGRWLLRGQPGGPRQPPQRPPYSRNSHRGFAIERIKT